jgi:chromosomal replication initiation ATPase DnaA
MILPAYIQRLLTKEVHAGYTTPAVLIARAALHFQLNEELLRAPSLEHIEERKMTIYLLVIHTRLDHRSVAKEMGLAGHTSVIRTLETVSNHLDTEPEYVARLDRLRDFIFSDDATCVTCNGDSPNPSADI